MWAAHDNASNINQYNAKSYCENYRGGGYTDWRMPTQNELAGLYDAGKTYTSNGGDLVHLTELIHLTSFVRLGIRNMRYCRRRPSFQHWQRVLQSLFFLRRLRPGPPGAFRQIGYSVIWCLDHFPLNAEA